MLGTYALSSGYYDAYYIKAQKTRTLIKRDFDEAFTTVDAIVAATSPTVAFKLGEKAQDPLAMYLNDVLTIPANMAGIPGISLTCGFADGLAHRPASARPRPRRGNLPPRRPCLRAGDAVEGPTRRPVTSPS